MNLGMAISTPVDKELLRTSCITQGVSAMALQAEKRHGRRKKRVVDRSMRCVAVGTVFGNITVLEGKGALLVHVTSGTGVLWRHSPEEFFLNGAMHVMTVDAGHLFLPEGVVRKEAVFRFHLWMTAVAEFGHCFVADLLLRAQVQCVAVEAADVIHGMLARIPVCQRRG